MAEPHLERTRAFSGIKSYEAYALYDTVRLAIFDEITSAGKLLFKIQQDGIVGEGEHAVMDLKAMVAGPLYLLLIDKIDYPKYPEKFRRLKEITPYATGQKSLKAMRFRQAVDYLFLFRSLVEAIGITRFEVEKKDENPANLYNEEGEADDGDFRRYD
jgi:hypothetical protein